LFSSCFHFLDSLKASESYGITNPFQLSKTVYNEFSYLFEGFATDFEEEIILTGNDVNFLHSGILGDAMGELPLGYIRVWEE